MLLRTVAILLLIAFSACFSVSLAVGFALAAEPGVPGQAAAQPAGSRSTDLPASRAEGRERTPSEP